MPTTALMIFVAPATPWLVINAAPQLKAHSSGSGAVLFDSKFSNTSRPGPVDVIFVVTAPEVLPIVSDATVTSVAPTSTFRFDARLTDTFAPTTGAMMAGFASTRPGSFGNGIGFQFVSTCHS